ncbi:MAG: DUF3471 domain-containing protein [Syntrophomonadaceae bacterium]
MAQLTVCFDEAGDGIVIMTNSGNGEGLFGPLLEKAQGNPYTPIEWEGFTPYDRLPPRPPLPQHERVKVDPAVLRRYVGEYLFPPDVLLTVRWRDTHLAVQENDEPEQELIPESATRFFTVAEDVYTFESDAHGRVTSLTLHVDGREIVATKRSQP